MSRGACSLFGRAECMSLKAKLEAVIYAAEEPVALAQLAALFADEVLPVPSAAAELSAVPELLSASNDQQSAGETQQIALVGLGSEASPEVPAEESVPQEGAPAAEGEEKKASRQRERQVRQALQGVLDELIAEYANSDRGMEIREIAGGYRMATKPEYHDAVRGFVKSLKPPMKLSLQALETLAVIAYKQPVTAPEVSEIRGVDSGGVLGSLVSRKLITTAGRKPVIGRPILYKTTKEFLLRFGLKDVSELPSIEEFEKMAGELAEAEAEGEARDAQDMGIVSEPATAEENPLFAGEEGTPPPAEQAHAEAAAGSETAEAEPAEPSETPEPTEPSKAPEVASGVPSE